LIQHAWDSDSIQMEGNIWPVTDLISETGEHILISSFDEMRVTLGLATSDLPVSIPNPRDIDYHQIVKQDSRKPFFLWIFMQWNHCDILLRLEAILFRSHKNDKTLHQRLSMDRIDEKFRYLKEM
jgi:hypothetical protein